MPTPSHPEADMLHMQHAQVVALIVRQHEAARLKAHRDAAAKARRAAATAPDPQLAPAAPHSAAPIHRPRPA
jgi:hypothetical protein